MNWITVQTEDDVERLMSAFGGFHDSCVREVHIWTETWVGDDLRMSSPGSNETHLRVIIQRQFKDPSAIEMQFDGVMTFRLHPDGNITDLFEATLMIDEDIIYWADEAGWRPDNDIGATFVASKRLAWRDASDWMGNKLRYGPGGQDE